MANLTKEAIDLADCLHSAAIHLLRAVRIEDRESGIGPAQLSALSVLVFGGSMSLSQLAAAEQVKPPTMVRIVQSLEEQKLVRTRADKADRRRLLIAATPKGRALMMRARSRRVEALAAALSRLGVDEQTHLRSALGVLRQVQAQLRERR